MIYLDKIFFKEVYTPMTLKKLFRRRINIAYLALLGVIAAEMLIGVLSVFIPLPGTFWASTFGINVFYIILYTVLAAALAVPLLKIRPSKLVNFNKFSIAEGLPAIFIMLGASIIMQYINNFIIYFMDMLGLTVADYDAGMAMPSDIPGYVGYMVLICVFPAVFEEILHRGIVLNALKPLNSRAAIIISAFGFSMFHMTLQQFPYAFMMGLALGWLAVRFDSIIPSMILHFCSNFYAGAITLMQDSGKYSESRLNNIYLAVCAALLFLGIGSAVIYCIQRKKRPAPKPVYRDPLPAGDAFTALMSAPLFWVHLVICVGMAVFTNFILLTQYAA